MNDEKLQSLEELEKQIKRYKDSWYKLAKAFKAIRDGAFAGMPQGLNRNSKEYKEHLSKALGYPTLKEYWEGKWQTSQRQVNRLIESADDADEASGPAGPDGISANEARRRAKAAKETVPEDSEEETAAREGVFGEGEEPRDYRRERIALAMLLAKLINAISGGGLSKADLSPDECEELKNKMREAAAMLNAMADKLDKEEEEEEEQAKAA